MTRPEELKKGYYLELNVIPNKFWIVGDAEPLEYITGNTDTAEFTSVANGANSGSKQIQVLEPDEVPRRIAWAKPGFWDGCVYQVKLPSGTDRMGPDRDKDASRISAVESPAICPNPRYGMWMVQNFYPSFLAINNTGEAVTPRIRFEGWKWDITEVVDPAIVAQLRTGAMPCVRLTIGGVTPAGV